MDEDEKAEIARRGVEMIDRAGAFSGEAIKDEITGAVKQKAGEAVLGGVRALASFTGTGPRRARVGPSADQVERTLARMEAESTAEFDAQLRVAASRTVAREADIDAREAEALAHLKRSFPAESKELALLLFACVDLLEDLAEIDDRPTKDELARKEYLIARIGALLAPRAETALRSFVLHVVELSREQRER